MFHTNQKIFCSINTPQIIPFTTDLHGAPNTPNSTRISAIVAASTLNPLAPEFVPSTQRAFDYTAKVTTISQSPSPGTTESRSPSLCSDRSTSLSRSRENSISPTLSLRSILGTDDASRSPSNSGSPDQPVVFVEPTDNRTTLGGTPPSLLHPSNSPQQRPIASKYINPRIVATRLEEQDTSIPLIQLPANLSANRIADNLKQADSATANRIIKAIIDLDLLTTLSSRESRAILRQAVRSRIESAPKSLHPELLVKAIQVFESWNNLQDDLLHNVEKALEGYFSRYHQGSELITTLATLVDMDWIPSNPIQRRLLRQVGNLSKTQSARHLTKLLYYLAVSGVQAKQGISGIEAAFTRINKLTRRYPNIGEGLKSRRSCGQIDKVILNQLVMASLNYSDTPVAKEIYKRASTTLEEVFKATATPPTPTPSQRTLYKALKAERVRTNHSSSSVKLETFVTFAPVDIFVRDLKLVVQVDGKVHEQTSKLAKDRFNTLLLRRLGYKVVRVTNDKIQKQNSEGKISNLARKILKKGQSKKKRPERTANKTVANSPGHTKASVPQSDTSSLSGNTPTPESENVSLQTAIETTTTDSSESKPNPSKSKKIVNRKNRLRKKRSKKTRKVATVPTAINVTLPPPRKSPCERLTMMVWSWFFPERTDS